MKSIVEEKILEITGRKLQYKPGEKIGVIGVDSFPALGTLTALRFLEWVQHNPEGVISLPTGKTPEYFIKEANRIIRTWEAKDTAAELESWGVDTKIKPDMRGLHFVQIDEFYPINPYHHNSFYFYVNKFYIEGFGLDKEKALVINCGKIGIPEGLELEDVWGDDPVDLSLRCRNGITKKERLQKRVIEAIDEWCMEYEDKIRAKGGIGFFLGGIGPDGHIGFNVRGSDMYSTTRLAALNYETQAAAASDLGGIEVVRKRMVITIGLATITYNKNCNAIIMAAGEAKAKVVADAVQMGRGIQHPATSLQVLPASRFYITAGAAKLLEERQFAIISESELSSEKIEKIVIDLALSKNKKIEELTEEDYSSTKCGRLLLKKQKMDVHAVNKMVSSQLKEKIEAGIRIRQEKRFLHTEPHHDDVMLGCLPFVVRHIREHSNHHHFATMTSGFTAVTNAYMLDMCRRMKNALEKDRYNFKRRLDEGYFDPHNNLYRNRDVWNYLDGVASRSEELREEGTLRRFLRDLIEVFDDTDLDNLRDRVVELINYFETQYPGKKDLDYIQKLKGQCREWESACLWGYFGWDSPSVEDMRLGFYTGDIFMEEPTINRDVMPVVELMRRVKPDVITVALDPEASGPDTHYKVLQAVCEALRKYEKESGKTNVEVIGYRNVWYRFHPSEADIFVPVSLNMLTLQYSSFMNTYLSQKDASFPSYEHDGPFPELAQKIQVEQYKILKTCLGRDYFYDHPSALIRATRGFVFLKSLKPEEFYSLSRDLKKRAENR
ncbi:MAG: glucosamine-6-phosphate deaminase [Spirochaetota bacterium]